MSEVSKFNLRLPAQLREDAGIVAEGLHLSLNAFIVQAVANYTEYQAKQLAKRVYTARARPAPSSVHHDFAGDDSDPYGQAPEVRTVQRTVPKVGANQPCPCGSGQKYKRCHGAIS